MDTDATYEQARARAERARRSRLQRHAAVLTPRLRRDRRSFTSPEVTAELIADGVHVEEAAMRLLLKPKARDASSWSAMAFPPLACRMGSTCSGNWKLLFPVEFAATPKESLAGSTLTLDRALRNIVGLRRPARRCRSQCSP